MSVRPIVAVALLAAVAVGCGSSKAPPGKGAARGVPGATFTVEVRGETAYYDAASATTLMLPLGGRVTAPGGLDCGISGGVASTRCRADYPWGTPAAPATVDLAATPDAAGGYGFYAFAGACSGSGACTVRGNADTFVLVRFARTQAGLGAHPNLSDPAAHGPAYRDFVAGAAGALQCTACHGEHLEGRGLALSCTQCHAHPSTLVVAGTVPATGGTVSLPAGPSLAFGAGALTAPTTITVGVTSAMPPVPADAQPVTAVYEFGPSGLTFPDPITVTFPIPDGVTNPVIYWTTPDGTAFEQVTGVVVGNTIQAQITHFSKAFVGVVDPARPRAASAVAGILDIKDGGYRLSLAVNGRASGGFPISSVAVAGPGIPASSLGAGCPWATSDCFNRNFFFGAVKPTPGAVYTFDVAFSDGTHQPLSATVADLGVGYPDPAFPTSLAVISASTPRFSWNAPAWGCVSSYVVLVNDQRGRVWSSGSLSPATRAIPFNFNGSARTPSLVDGPYTWNLFAFDCSGPSGSEIRNSARVQNIPFAVSGAPGVYRVRGVVSGLSRSGLVLAMPGEPPVSIPAGATGFAFPYALATGTAYDVSILQQPVGQTCVVTGSRGVVGTGNVTDVAVRCGAFWNNVAAGGGGAHSAAILGDGTLWTWGGGGSGQLGTGFPVSQPLPAEVGAGFAAVAAGGVHTLAVQEDGTLWSWGLDNHGQLGDGGSAARGFPQPIGSGFAAVGAGRFFSGALTTDGTLWMWGDNSSGQLGLGTTADQPFPIPVGSGYVGFSIRESHTLALRSDGSLWAWGSNGSGQLGIGRSSTMEMRPVFVGAGYAAVSTGASHSLALKADGTLWAWGSNSNGQLGDGTTVSQLAPVQIGSGFVAVAARGFQSFAVRTDGTLWAWGANPSGQLGIGSTAEVHAPTLVGRDFVAVAAGSTHTLAMKTDGSLWAWGANGSGQVGDGTTIQRLTPVEVVFPTGAGGGTATIGGNATGVVTGGGLVLRDSFGEYLAVPASGPFTFPTPLPIGTPYEVTVAQQPTNPPQTCVVSNGAGTLTGAVTSVSVSCTGAPPATPGPVLVPYASGTTEDLYGIWGSAPWDVWVVGANGTILHWNGLGWARVPSGTTLPLREVWAASATDAWAVGNDVILHWDGMSWSTAYLGSIWFGGVWGSAANDVWAVGDLGFVWHWDGSGWSQLPPLSSSPIDLHAVRGSSANDVWAVGSYGLAAHWDGASWTSVMTGTGNPLDGVAPSSPSDAWAIGNGGAVQHWDGSAWRPAGPPTTDLHAIWSNGPNDVWAAGWAGTALHWDGVSWTSVPTGTGQGFHGLWGSGDDVWAIGLGGTILHLETPVQPANCGDLAELPGRWTARSYAPPGTSIATTMSAVTGPGIYRGLTAVRATTSAPFDFALVYTLDAPLDVSAFDELRFAVRAANPNAMGWQGAFPLVTLQDASGNRQSFTPASQLMPVDGTTWAPISVPLRGGGGWTLGLAIPEGDPALTIGGTLDLARITRIGIHTNTWDWLPYTLDVDGVSFEHAQMVCAP